MKKYIVSFSLLCVVSCSAFTDGGYCKKVGSVTSEFDNRASGDLQEEITPGSLFEEYPEELTEPEKHEAPSWIKIKTQQYGVAVLTAYLACKEKTISWFDYLYAGAKTSAQSAYNYMINFFKKPYKS